MKTSMSKTENTLEGLNGALDIVEEKISDLEGRAIKTTQKERQRETRMCKN